MSSLAESSTLTSRGAGTGAQQLAAISSFGGEEPLRLPFNLQRHQLFLVLVAAVAMVAVAVGAGVKPIVGVGIVVAVAAACAVALNEMLGLILLAALAAATSGLGRGVPIPGMRFSQVLIGGVGIVLLASARRFVRWSVFDWLALLYAVATFGLGGWDLLQQGRSFNTGEIQLLLGPVQFLLLYRATLITARTPERRRLALRLLICASVPVALLALGQQFNFPGIRSLIVTLTKNNVYAAGTTTARVTGPFPLWHNLGGYLLMVLLAIAAVQTKRVQGILSRPVMLGIAALDLVALVETLDLTPLIALVAGILIIGVWLGGLNRVLIGIAVLLAVGMLVFGGRLNARFSSEFGRSAGTDRSSIVPQTIQYRYDLWANVEIPLLRGHSATGYGPVLPAELQNFPYTESQYINYLYRGGIALLVVWAAMFVAMGMAGVRSARDGDPLQRALGVAVATAVICLVFMNIVEAYFVDDGTPQVLWTLLGLLAFHEVPSARNVDRPVPFEHPTTRRAWAANVALAFDALDPSSQELLRLSYGHALGMPEIQSVMGLNADAIRRWQSSALERLAMHAHMTPPAVERLLRSGSVPLRAW